MKIKYYLVLKIIYSSGRKETVSSYKIREEDKNKVEESKDGIIEAVRSCYRDADSALINVGDKFINLAATASVEVKTRYVFW